VASKDGNSYIQRLGRIHRTDRSSLSKDDFIILGPGETHRFSRKCRFSTRNKGGRYDPQRSIWAFWDLDSGEYELRFRCPLILVSESDFKSSKPIQQPGRPWPKSRGLLLSKAITIRLRKRGMPNKSIDADKK